MFDVDWLPEAQASLVLVTDTHQVRDADSPAMREFPSRGKQSARARVALEMAAALPCDQRVHLGDLIQEYPESPDYQDAVENAHRALRELGFECHIVAGNQDVGDKPDATMPSNPVTPARLESFHQRFNHSWYSFELGPVRCVVINSQILNRPDLAESAEQRDWLERTLAQSVDEGKRLFLFLHLPLFLAHRDEPGLGHYDNLGQPDRAWLIELIERHNIERTYSGHVHWRFLNRVGAGLAETVASTGFTRPGFGHLFASAAAPEQGRDDAPKLGFYWIRLTHHGVEPHLVRTHGWTQLPDAVKRGAARWVVTRTAAGLPDSRVGVTLRHPLANPATVPAAWPSVVPQPVRNAYPLLALREAGVRHLRVPIEEVLDEASRSALSVARDEGMRVTAMVMHGSEAAQRFNDAGDPTQAELPIDELEWRVPATGAASDGVASWDAGAEQADRPRPVALSPVMPNERVPGKQHHRTRLGFALDELEPVSRALERLDQHVDRLLLRVPPNERPWAFFAALRGASRPPRIGALDVLLELGTDDDHTNARRLAEGLLGVATVADARLSVDPLIDFDRTMDACHGLLDTRCNPRPPFHVLRMLNTLLFATPATPCEAIGDTPRPAVRRGGRVWVLVGGDDRALREKLAPTASGKAYGLTQGWSTNDAAPLRDTLEALDESLWLCDLAATDAEPLLAAE